VFLPAKPPLDVVDRLNSETLKALQSPKLQQKVAALGVDPMVMTPKEFNEYVHKEIVRDSVLIKTAGIKVE
jgi:tripartite-type tricarboxylate transporter receptor subunit TctC